jgi:octanoyl-[GcvH]:protein N-octanoyltransferase
VPAGRRRRLGSCAVTTVAVLRQAGTGRGALDVAFALALLERVSRGEEPSTLRLLRPGPTVAFGRLDALRPGFAAAARAARDDGFEPVLRGPGGRAAAYHEASLVVELAMADADPVTGVQARFADMAALLAGALRSVGVDARVGAVPGEYCPGAYSVNAGGRAKLVGTAQRIVRGAWLFAGSVVVCDPEPVRRVLTDVYAALELGWDPATAAAVSDTVPDVTVDAVETAVLRAFGERFVLREAASAAATEEAARGRQPLHVLPA